MHRFHSLASKALRTCHSFAHGIVRLEHPFHLFYLGAGTVYYASHEVIAVALGSGGLFVVVLVSYLIDGE